MNVLFLLDEISVGQEPLGVTLITAVLEEHGHTVDFWRFQKFTEEETKEFILSYKPGLIGFHITTGLHAKHLDMCRKMKEYHNFVSYFGGPHATFFPEFIEYDGVDVICKGEGEYPTLELVEGIEKGTDYTKIQNLWVKKDGKITKNACRPFIEDLDALPFPAKEAFLNRCEEVKNGNLLYTMAGRGCPYNCNFCFNHVIKKMADGKYVRWRSVDNVIAEIKWAQKYLKFDAVAFQDDTFILNKKWIMEFAEKYPKEIGLPYLCHARADLSKPEIIDALKRSGCIRVAIGLESGNEHIRNNIMKKQISTEQLLNAGELYEAAGIEVLAQNLFAVPGETVETALSTIELNIKMKIHCTVIHFFVPYPRTGLGDMAEEQGLYNVSIDNLPASNHWGPVLSIDNAEVIGFIGNLMYLFVDYPWIYYLARPFIKYIKNDTIRVFILKVLRKLENPLRRITKNPIGCRWHPYFM